MKKYKQCKVTNFFTNNNPQSTLNTTQSNNDKQSQICETNTVNIHREIIQSDYDTDIAFYVAKNKPGARFTDMEIINILNIKLENTETQNYPLSTFGNQRRSFQKSWIYSFPWLTYSASLDKVFCKFCFIQGTWAGNGQDEKCNLGWNGFNGWNKALEKLKKHESKEYHVKALHAAQALIGVLKDPSLCILNKIDTQRKQQVEKNRKSLKSIVETIILCGRQGLPLRGHRESSSKMTDLATNNNEGNFKALLAFRILSGDLSLKSHMESAPRNAIYTSPEIQNEIINICGELILNQIVQKVNKSKCFSVLADETTDVSKIEQLTICARYFDGSEGKMRENFLAFVPVADLTGEAVADKILSTLSQIGIKTKYMRGQGYDGAANMSGKFKGVQTKVREQHPFAIYTHCASHRLNLVIGETCSAHEIQNTFLIIRKVIKFFSKSTKRSHILTEVVRHSSLPNLKKLKLLKMCETRWVERHDCVLRFADLLEVIVLAMEDIRERKDTESKTKVKIRNLLSNLQTSEFVVGLHCAVLLLGITLPLSKNLQNINIDLISCFEMINDIKKEFSRIRSNAAQEFQTLFSKIDETCSKIRITLQIPRKCSRQSYRPNYPTTVPEEFFRQSIFVPVLDHFISELENRFGDFDECVLFLVKLMPQNVIKVEDLNEFSSLVKFYISDIMCDASFYGELRRWKQKWNKVKLEEMPKNAIEALQFCNDLHFPIMYKLLKILATIPVTTSTPERSFSVLKRLKSYIRSTMGEDRLLGLALLNIYREIDISADEVIRMFVLKKDRALEFVI